MFQNREEAGLLLAKKLQQYKENKDAQIWAIPRGGVVVGREIAANLHIPLDILIVKKLGAPGNPELAIGAVTSSGVNYIDWDLASRVGADEHYINEEIERRRKEVEEREKKWKNVQRSRIPLRGREWKISKKKLIILVDDGIATGATTLTAIKYIKNGKWKMENGKWKKLNPYIILAVPVIAKDTYEKLKLEVDEIIALEIPEFFQAVGQFYREFRQISDDEVERLLDDR